jgi:hypothetical protein
MRTCDYSSDPVGVVVRRDVEVRRKVLYLLAELDKRSLREDEIHLSCARTHESIARSGHHVTVAAASPTQFIVIGGVVRIVSIRQKPSRLADAQMRIGIRI